MHAMLVRELSAALAIVQKVHNIYQTRCDPEDFADTVEKLRWKILDYAALRQSSVTFFSLEEPETAVSRWSRAKTRVTRVVKGLSEDDKAQKLACKYWLEAIDPRHRYGGNLHLYYVEWQKSQSPQPFFYWLDYGDGRQVSLEQCPRITLQDQCIKYLGPKEREAYEVIIDSGKLVNPRSGCPVDSAEGTKWIFVLSTSRILYVGQKIKGLFQHSSLVAGGPTVAAGRIISCKGILQAIWSYSGHYRPPEENFLQMISFLEGHHVDLSHVKTFPLDDDIPPPPPCKTNTDKQPNSETTIIIKAPPENNPSTTSVPFEANNLNINADSSELNIKTPEAEMQRRLYSKCKNLQFQELEDANLPPRDEARGRVICRLSPTSKLCNSNGPSTGLIVTSDIWAPQQFFGPY